MVEVDFIPEMVMGDMKKISDTDKSRYNVKVNNIINLINMHKGTLTDYPEVGVFNSLVKLFFSEDETFIMEEISEDIRVLNPDVEVYFSRDDEGIINISIDVQDIMYNAKILQENDTIKIAEPRVINKEI